MGYPLYGLNKKIQISGAIVIPYYHYFTTTPISSAELGKFVVHIKEATFETTTQHTGQIQYGTSRRPHNRK